MNMRKSHVRYDICNWAPLGSAGTLAAIAFPVTRNCSGSFPGRFRIPFSAYPGRYGRPRQRRLDVQRELSTATVVGQVPAQRVAARVEYLARPSSEPRPHVRRPAATERAVLVASDLVVAGASAFAA